MNDQPEQFIPESLKPPRYAPARPKRVGFLEVGSQVLGALGAAVLLVFLGAIVLEMAGPGGLVAWLVCLLVGWVVLEVKAQDKMHVAWVAFLGPIGLVILLVLPNAAREARAKSAAEVDRALRAEELRVQKAILAELQSARAKSPEKSAE